jgi:hypothetical protein
MSADSLNANELVVEAEYFKPARNGSISMSRVHEQLRSQMKLDQYWPENPQRAALNPKTITYVRIMDEAEKTRLWRLKRWLNLTNEAELERENYIDNLRRLRDDLPFILRFRFIPIEFEDNNGLLIEIKSEPAVLHKHEQIDRVENYNAQNAIRRGKEQLEDVAVELGWETIREPHTTAENLEDTLNREIRNHLRETKYGNYVIELIDEGDEALRYQLLHPALSSYIHAIEWAIICYLEDERIDDLVAEEISDEFGYYYGQLINKIPEGHGVSQKTREELEQFKTYRRWMGHHKSGELTESNVATVKDRLRILTEELFL